LAILNIYISAS